MFDMRNLRRFGKIEASAPAAMAGFNAFNEAALAEGAVPKKSKELIALDVALTTQCGYCLELHRKAAIAAGATEQKLAETVMVAAALRTGAALTHGTHLLVH